MLKSLDCNKWKHLTIISLSHLTVISLSHSTVISLRGLADKKNHLIFTREKNVLNKIYV